MSDAEVALLVQALAIVAMGTAGCCLQGIAATAGARVLGVGLVVATALAAVDSLPLTGRGLPLAGLALFAFACLASGPRGSKLAETLAATPLRLAVVGTAAALLLHQAHVVAPHQHVVDLVVPWYPLDLACALGLGWLAVTQRELASPLRALLAAAALGLAATSFAGPQRDAFAAAMLGAGCAGILVRGLHGAPRCFAVAAATTSAIALTCALRAGAAAHGAPQPFAGLDDPLLVLAALFAAFGVALHREHVALAAGVAAPPLPPPTAEPDAAWPIAATDGVPEPDAAPQPAAEPTAMATATATATGTTTATAPATAEPAPAPTPADVVDLPDEAEAMRVRAEVERTVGELFPDDEVRTTVRDDAPVPARTDAD